MLRDFCDGSASREHSLFSSHANALQIFFYYDEVEVVNPIGSHRKVHKLGKPHRRVTFVVMVLCTLLCRGILFHTGKFST